MKQYRLKISYDERFSYSWGYALYSAFLSKLTEEKAKFLHEDLAFSQYLMPAEWIINTNIDLEIEQKYFLQKYNTNINIDSISVLQINEQEMADRFLVNQAYKKNIRLKFLTPTTFKQDNAYALYPTKDLILQSLTNKWNNFAKTFILEDMEWESCKISKYSLRSATFNLKDARIHGFVGYVDLFFWGSESIIRLGNLVCDFGKYSGIGIKTSLGMGGFISE